MDRIQTELGTWQRTAKVEAQKGWSEVAAWLRVDIWGRRMDAFLGFL